jgi:hypothetical protein
MGKLLDLLKASTGEASMFSKLGLWRQRVSIEVAQIQIQQILQYMQVRGAIDQSFAAVGDIVLDDVTTSVGGLTYDTATGLWTLDANTTYELEFFGWFANFGGVGDVVQTDWVDSTNTTLVTPFGATFGGYFTPGGLSTIGASNKPVSKVIYRTGAVQEVVKIRVMNVTSTVDMQAGSYAIVRKVG